MKSADVKGRPYAHDVPNRIAELGLANSNAVIHPAGSVMMAMSGRGKTRGMTCVLAIPCACSQSVAAIMPQKEKWSAEFLHYDFQLRYEELRNITGSYDRSGLNLQLIRNIKVPRPPIHEQNKMSQILVAVDYALQTTDEIICKAQQLKKGLMQQLLTKGIGHTKLKPTEIGEVPEEWEVSPLKRVVESYRNGIYKRAEFYNRGVPSIRMYNIEDGRINTIDAPLLEVTQEELEQYGLKAGDILVNRVNSIDLVGKAGIVPDGLGPVTFESKNIRIRVNAERCNPQFLAYFVSTNNWYRQVRSSIKPAISQATINQDDLNRILIPLPPLEEQRRVAEILSAIDEKMDKEQDRKEYLEQLKQGLMQVLLTGKVRVKVN